MSHCEIDLTVITINIVKMSWLSSLIFIVTALNLYAMMVQRSLEQTAPPDGGMMYPSRNKAHNNGSEIVCQNRSTLISLVVSAIIGNSVTTCTPNTTSWLMGWNLSEFALASLIGAISAKIAFHSSFEGSLFALLMLLGSYILGYWWYFQLAGMFDWAPLSVLLTDIVRSGSLLLINVWVLHDDCQMSKSLD